MIKRQDNNQFPSSGHASYADGQPVEVGISFEKRDGTRHFAPYAFLSSVDLVTPEELVFRFTQTQIFVRGKGLSTLWEKICRETLTRLSESSVPAPASAGGVVVSEIIIQHKTGTAE